MKDYFPQEFYIELTNNENLLGRICVLKYHEKFNIELDIVLKESRKIYKHIGIYHNYDDKQEAIDNGMLKFSQYLSSVKK